MVRRGIQGAYEALRRTSSHEEVANWVVSAINSITDDAGCDRMCAQGCVCANSPVARSEQVCLANSRRLEPNFFSNESPTWTPKEAGRWRMPPLAVVVVLVTEDPSARLPPSRHPLSSHPPGCVSSSENNMSADIFRYAKQHIPYPTRYIDCPCVFFRSLIQYEYVAAHGSCRPR